MKILYIHQYFLTPQQAGGTRSYYVAKALLAEGHKVTIITSHNKGDKFSTRKNIDGIDVIYIKNSYSSKMSKYSRLISFIKFMFFSTYFSLKERNIDIVFATSTPITVGIPGLLVKKLKRKKFIFEVRDLWPDVPWEMGYIRSKLFYKLMKIFENYIYNNADKIVSISYGIKNKIKKNFQQKVRVFPFGANIDLFTNNKNYNWKKEINITHPTLYVFTGSIGIANNLSYLIEAAELLEKKNDNIFIAVIGNGSDEENIRNLIIKKKLRNIKLFPAVPLNKLVFIYQSADAGIILFGDKSNTYRYTASPNKFFDYIAAGLPFFFNFEGPLKEEILRENIGIYADYTNPGELAEKMDYYANNITLLRAMGKSARELAESRYNRKKILKELSAYITT